MSAQDACLAAATGLRERYPGADIVSLPMSDGGEGLVACVSRMTECRRVECAAHGPLLEPMTASYIISADGRTAYMEMAETSGLTLVPEHLRNPLLTSTCGVGDMIADATTRGVRRIVMGIGGSATCDGGMGMVQRLRETGLVQQPEIPVACDVSNPLPEITVACDVTNPLYGPEGAACVFGPQKGATPLQVIELDRRLRQLARDTERLGLATEAMAEAPGAGAAGGLGYGLMAYLGATLVSGIDVLLDIARFDQAIAGTDLILTGEGRSDRQTLMGKVPMGILRRASAKGSDRKEAESVAVHLLSGGIDDAEALRSAGFASVWSINASDARPLHVLMRRDVAMENMMKCCSSQEW